MTLTPGSAAWLMRHEFRLYTRSGVMRTASVAALVIVEVLLHLIAVGVALGMRAARAYHGPAVPSVLPLLIITAALGVAFILLLSRCLNGIVQVLYTRADLDLLLSSPVAPAAIISVRVGTVALTGMLELAMLVWPFADVFVLFGMFGWARLYLLLPALAMLATCVAVLLALTLFRLLGPRTTRVFGQLLASLIGIGIFVLTQLPNLMRHAGHERGGHPDPLRSVLHADPSRLGPLLTPARLILDGYGPSLLFTLISAALLLLTVRVLSDRFVNAATAIGSVGSARSRTLPSRPLRFRQSQRAVLVAKELRLIRRDPLLLTQLLQQAIFILPSGLVLWRTPFGTGRVPWVWFLIILIAGTLASALAWITIVAEDAPDLLMAAPLARTTVVRTKIEAALLPLLPLWLAPIALLWRTQLWFSISVALCACGCSITTAVLQIHRPPARRDSFKTRGKTAPGKGFLELGVVLGWMLVCALLVWLGIRLP